MDAEALLFFLLVCIEFDRIDARRGDASAWNPRDKPRLASSIGRPASVTYRVWHQSMPALLYFFCYITDLFLRLGTRQLDGSSFFSKLILPRLGYAAPFDAFHLRETTTD